MRGEKGFLNEWKYDLTKGCSGVEFHGYDPNQSLDEVKVCEYELVGGAWVPKKIERTVKKNGMLFIKETTEFRHDVVNKPLGKGDFTVEKIGLRRGEVIADGRTGLEYTYEGAIPGDEPVGKFALDEMQSVAKDVREGDTPDGGQAGVTEATTSTTAGTAAPAQGDSEGVNHTVVYTLALIAVGVAAVVIVAVARRRRSA
jgi:hypothetical protein